MTHTLGSPNVAALDPQTTSADAGVTVLTELPTYPPASSNRDLAVHYLAGAALDTVAGVEQDRANAVAAEYVDAVLGLGTLDFAVVTLDSAEALARAFRGTEPIRPASDAYEGDLAQAQRALARLIEAGQRL